MAPKLKIERIECVPLSMPLPRKEAVCAGVVKALREDDYVSYTYRGHGQCLARGMDLEAAFAELTS